MSSQGVYAQLLFNVGGIEGWAGAMNATDGYDVPNQVAEENEDPTDEVMLPAKEIPTLPVIKYSTQSEYEEKWDTSLAKHSKEVECRGCVAPAS